MVGDRWTLLIVRELLIRGACRYTDIRNGLAGIATNLLAERLIELEVAGIVVSKLEPPPIATTLFRLTDRGRDLEQSLLQLGRWGAPLLAERKKNDDFQAHWLVLPLKLLLVDNAPQEPQSCIELRMPKESIAIEVGSGKIEVRLGTSEFQVAVVTGKSDLILQLMTGRISLADATAKGVDLQGSSGTVLRVIPATIVTKDDRAAR